MTVPAGLDLDASDTVMSARHVDAVAAANAAQSRAMQEPIIGGVVGSVLGGVILYADRGMGPRAMLTNPVASIITVLLLVGIGVAVAVLKKMLGEWQRESYLITMDDRSGAAGEDGGGGDADASDPAARAMSQAKSGGRRIFRKVANKPPGAKPKSKSKGE